MSGAGYYNTLKFDLSDKIYSADKNLAINNYAMNLNAVSRQGATPSFPLGHLGQPNAFDQFGPLRGVKVTQDSFLQGRGQSLSKDPSSDVRWLPESLFVNAQTNPGNGSCQRTDLDPVDTRVPRACNGLSETDTSNYSMFPERWQNSYAGMHAVVNTNIQTRDPPYMGPGIGDSGQPQPKCRANYGDYNGGLSMTPYSLY